jgi:hypothetical protein
MLYYFDSGCYRFGVVQRLNIVKGLSLKQGGNNLNNFLVLLAFLYYFCYGGFRFFLFYILGWLWLCFDLVYKLIFPRLS